jgi:site-specific DNA-methyltransferase (adenine-specific)
VYPKGLPEWFIKLFSVEGDTVLDPFSGSGTTCLVAMNFKRNSIGVELLTSYHEIACQRILDEVKGSSYSPE